MKRRRRRESYIGAGEIVLFGREWDGWSDGKVAAFVFVEDSSEHGRRVKVGYAITLDWKKRNRFAC